MRSIRDFTRLCRVALLRVFRRTALLCGTAQCSASLSPPPAALSFAYPEPASAGPGFKPAPLKNKKPPFRTAFSFWWGIRDFTRLCRVALLRVFRRTALLCGTAQCSASLSPPPAALSFAYPEPASAGPGFKPAPLKNKKPPFRTAFSFWWGIRDLNPGPAGYEPDALTN